jgi:hypothetical protein
MAGRGAPTFLKRQKEQKRAARALAKREAKQARRADRAAESKPDDVLEDVSSPDALEDTTQAPEEGDEAK